MSPTTPRVDPLSYLADDLEQMKAQGLYRRLRVLEDEQRAHTTFDGRSVVNLSSNNYLGLTTHPKLRQKALEAIERYGVGTGSVRTIAGTMSLHMELERRLAEFKHTEATVVFQSGFTANAGTVSAILTKEDVVISDELNHASIIDGCRLSRAAIKVFPHRDADAARKILRELPRRTAQAAHHRRRLQHGRRPGRVAGSLRRGRGIRRHHDGGRRPCERRVREERPRHRGSLRHARTGRRPGGHTVEGDRRAWRLRRRQHGVHRVPSPPRPAVPLLDVASAVGHGDLSGRARCAARGAADHRSALGQHALLQEGPRRSRLQHRRQRKPHHPGHRR